MWLGIKLEGWLTIAAILLGPVLAFAVQHWRDMREEDRTRRRQIFQQLLLTLKVPMAPRHVDALNSIPLEFYSAKTVMQAWREYTSHLNNQAMLKGNPRGWADRKLDLLVGLAFEMGASLKYSHIDKATLRDSIYVPQGYEDNEESQRRLQKAFLQVLQSERPVSIALVGPVQVSDPLPLPTVRKAAPPAPGFPSGKT